MKKNRSNTGSLNIDNQKSKLLKEKQNLHPSLKRFVFFIFINYEENITRTTDVPIALKRFKELKKKLFFTFNVRGYENE